MAMALLKAELDPDFEKLCKEIEVSRKTRGIALLAISECTCMC
jgi:hypothetical protein